MQRSGAYVVMMDVPAADDSKHQELSWHGLIYMSSLTCTQQAGPSSESSEHSVMAATRSAQEACDIYKPQHGN